MKSSRWMKIGAGLLTGSVLTLVPLATAQAADLYDSLKELTDHRMESMGSMHSPDSGKGMERSSSYGSHETYGPQGPVRSDMDKERMAVMPAPTTPSVWDQIRKQLGPIGGD